MRSYPKLRKTTKWGGAAMTLVLVVVWSASLQWTVAWTYSDRGELRCRGGLVVLEHVADEYAGARFGTRGLRIKPWRSRPEWQVRFEHYKTNWNPRGHLVPDTFFIDLPLWLPALLTLAVTIPAWRLDALARRRSGLCNKCGSSLVGLPAGSTCPECGGPGTGSTS